VSLGAEIYQSSGNELVQQVVENGRRDNGATSVGCSSLRIAATCSWVCGLLFDIKPPDGRKIG